jgi:hypothetical protein
MRRLLLLTLFALPLLALPPAAGPARAADQDFTLINSTGYVIVSVYVSPSSSSNWGPDVLGAAVLPAGQQAAITFPEGTQGCAWDLKVTYDDNDSSEWTNVNLCSISRVTLFWNRQAGTTRAVAE